jgi:NAD(P)H-hydrate epimerase
MPESADAAGLAELLMETGQRHHQAFIDTDGVDPEWALWYADHLTGRIDAFVDAEPTKARIIQCLMNAADALARHSPDEPWPPFYANYILGLGPEGMATEHTPA